MKRYYVGVDWADEFHQVWVSDAEGKKAPYVRKDVASRINVRRGEREGQASESATIGGV